MVKSSSSDREGGKSWQAAALACNGGKLINLRRLYRVFAGFTQFQSRLTTFRILMLIT